MMRDDVSGSMMRTWQPTQCVADPVVFLREAVPIGEGEGISRKEYPTGPL